MFKKYLILSLALIVTLSFTPVVFSAETGPEGNDRKGKYTYRKVYKACAADGNVESAKPTVSPSDKTMAQWKEIFEGKNFESFGCLDNWNALAEKDVQDIYAYFYNHASDSPAPATCK